MAALLAQQGFLATSEFLTAADGGLYNTYTNGGKPEAATSGLGERWELVFSRGALSVRVYAPAPLPAGEHQVEFPADALWVF